MRDRATRELLLSFLQPDESERSEYNRDENGRYQSTTHVSFLFALWWRVLKLPQGENEYAAGQQLEMHPHTKRQPLESALSRETRLSQVGVTSLAQGPGLIVAQGLTSPIIVG